VITVDLMLPDRDGYSVIEALRSSQNDACILILFFIDGVHARWTFHLQASRERPARLSLGAENEVALVLDNAGNRQLHVLVRDEAPAPFMLELPDYKLPRAKSVAIGVFTRAKMFLQRAGTTIFGMMVLIWFLASFPQPPAGAEQPAINYSLAAWIGHALEPLLGPVGFNWQIAVALIPGMAAREVAVAALGSGYAIEGGKEAAAQIGLVLASKWSLATALSLLVWYIFAPQCASTLAVIRRETGSWKWMALTFGYMLTLAYLASFLTYQIARAFGAG
jgi:ferrous iron transport protein B